MQRVVAVAAEEATIVPIPAVQRVVAVAAPEGTIVPIPAVHRVVAVAACANEPTGGSGVAQVRGRDTERERQRGRRERGEAGSRAHRRSHD